jgi:4-hydroxy-3-methylbut-2-enyl diphosphate reductase
MKITIDEYSGFCFGVTAAIDAAERELQRGTLFCLGDIVHNGQEVARLEDLGLVTIDYDDLRTLHKVRVLLRAHGEPPSTYRIAQQNNIEIVDASCPVVLKLQKRIRETYLQHHGTDAQIVIFGQKGHAEVVGLEGQTNNTAIVVESLKDLDILDYNKPIYFFSQTTKSVEGFRALVVEIEKRRIETMPGNHREIVFEYHDTICRNVANRVKRLQEFAKGNDVIIFVGGKKSSNAKVLYNHCLEVNPSTIFVSGEEDITKEILEVCREGENVGICGATSTPKWLMERVKLKIESL